MEKQFTSFTPMPAGPQPTSPSFLRLQWRRLKDWFWRLSRARRWTVLGLVGVASGGLVVAALWLWSHGAPPAGTTENSDPVAVSPEQTAGPHPSVGKPETSSQPTNKKEQSPEKKTPPPPPSSNSTPPPPPSTSGAGSGQSGGSSGGSGGSTPSCALPNYPDASCTGVPSGVSLTTFNGDFIITTPGAVIEGRHIVGCVAVQAANVIIRNSKITCGGFYGIASYNGGNDDGGLVVEDVEIDCAHNNTTAISYRGLTVRRAHIHGCENGLHIDSDVSISDSYIHDIYEGASGHGDGIQGPDGSNSLIDHNTIYAESTTAAINLNNDSGGPHSTNVTISNNLLAGGANTLYCPIPATTNFRILNNHFSTIFYPTVGAFNHSTACGDDEVQSGNVIHQTGNAITLN